MSRLWLLLPLVLLGCSPTDPYERPGMWQPEGVNAGNMAAMVERPSDLHRGRGNAGPTRMEAQAAVARVWEGRERPLPYSTTTDTGPSSPTPQPGGH